MTNPIQGQPPWQAPPQYLQPAPPPPAPVRLHSSTTLIGVIVAAIVVLVTAGLIWGGNQQGSGASAAVKDLSNSSSASPTGSTTPPPAPNSDTIKKLTVDYKSPSVNCVDLLQGADIKVVKQVYLYDIGVRKAVQKGNSSLRQWTDAISTGLPGSTPAAKRQSLQIAICIDPYLGSVWENMFAGLHVGNVSVLSYNSWLQPAADATTINDRAMSFGAMFDPKGVTEAQATAYVKQNTAWQHEAEAIDTLISVLDPIAIKALPSVQNWHCLNYCMVGKGLPEAGLNPKLPDNLTALVLAVTQKGACAPLKEIGANTGDMRPEVFVTPTCIKQGKSTPQSSAPAPSSSTPNQGCNNCGGSTPPSTSHSTPPAGHSTCPCISKTSASQSKPAPATGASGVPTGGNGPATTEPGTQPTGGITTPPGPTDTNHGSETNTPTPLPTRH